MRNTTAIGRFQTGLIVGLMAAAMMSLAAYAGDPGSDDPVAMAATYEKQAADLRAQADKHDAMAKMHRGGAGSSKLNHENVTRHCEKIAANLRAAAQESDALAAELRASAKK